MRAQPEMTPKALVPFLSITFGLTWGLAAILFFFYDQVVALFGEISMSNPLFILAVYAPGFASVFLILRHYGLSGLGSFARRFTLWRASTWWWLFIIFAIPAIMYAGAAIKGSDIASFPFSPWYQAIPALALALVLGPIEEIGWRGLALPLLQKRMAPFWAGLILGVIWMVWHIPGFLIGGTMQSGWAFAPFFIGGVSISLIVTALFNETRGSLLLPFLLHFQMNNPIWPDAQPWDNFLLAALAILIVWLNRRKLFQRGAGLTHILFSEEGDVASSQRVAG
ncbi:MAG: CPBP family intramembrane metalloprotease [Anaerolineae bacterium]|nr:CPBP family intramembrane metalloprotease [Anaerolineae bacterium]